MLINETCDDDPVYTNIIQTFTIGVDNSFHSGHQEDYCFLSFDTVKSGKSVLTFIGTSCLPNDEGSILLCYLCRLQFYYTASYSKT